MSRYFTQKSQQTVKPENDLTTQVHTRVVFVAEKIASSNFLSVFLRNQSLLRITGNKARHASTHRGKIDPTTARFIYINIEKPVGKRAVNLIFRCTHVVLIQLWLFKLKCFGMNTLKQSKNRPNRLRYTQLPNLFRPI